jgi:hypothetical protein
MERNVELLFDHTPALCFWAKINGASAPLSCVVGRVSTFRSSISEMRDHTQENQRKNWKKCIPQKLFSARTEWGSNCFLRLFSSRILSRIFVRKLFL